MSAPTLSSRLTAWLGARALRCLSSFPVGSFWRAKVDEIYDDVTAKLVMSLASVPGDVDLLEEALVAAWCDATGREPRAQERPSCRLLAEAAAHVRAHREAAAAVTAVSTATAGGDA